MLSVACRIPFLHLPLTNDEGGYAYVARRWASGVALYHGAWVDRPQVLVLLFRLAVALDPTTEGLRLFAACYAAVTASVVGLIAGQLSGRRAGLVAGALYVVFASGPQVEGFILNGELLAALPSATAVALLLVARNRRRPVPYLYLAGIAAGMALLVKQSAIDPGVVVVMGSVLPWHGRWQRGRARLRIAIALCGVMTPLAASALHGALTGWTEYIDAVLLDNLRYRAADGPAGPVAPLLAQIGSVCAEDAVLLVAAVMALQRARRSAHLLVPVVWLAAALIGVMIGGLFSRHYFVQLLAPLCLLASLGLTASVRAGMRRPGAVLWLGPVVAALALAVSVDAPYVTGSPLSIARRLYGWPVYAYQAELVALLRHRVPEGEPFFTAYAAAPLHYLTGRPSITRYLWRRPLATVPGAYRLVLEDVREGKPVCIVAVQSLVQAPGDERMRDAVAHRYVSVWRRPGLDVWCRRAPSR